MSTESFPSDLLDLFPEADYRHRMKFRPGTVAQFFGKTGANEELLAQRRRWLESDPGLCAGALPEARALVGEAVTLLRAERVLPEEAFAGGQPAELLPQMIALGRLVEPDVLLLRWEEPGHFRLLAGCVCFPSSWSLAEKLGGSLPCIHDPVPGLNAQLGAPIEAFLAKMEPGAVWLRRNWGLSRSAELNQHPARNLPKLDASVGPDEVWLRIENQALVRLPLSCGVLFGIRIKVYPLREVTQKPLLAQRLARALRTMPGPMLLYKNLADARGRLLDMLR